MKNLRNERGITGIDIAIAVIVIFIFVSIIAVLISRTNSRAREIELKTEALDIAVTEIEKVKNDGFEAYETYNKNTTQDKNGNSLVDQATGTQGFYKTISILDYTDLEGNEDAVPNLVKKVTVTISYQFKGKTQNVELSTILSKENR